MGDMIDSVPAHGGNLRLASARYDRKDWLDFSANINPMGVPEPVADALTQAICEGRLAHYPDPDSLELRRVLAEYHKLTIEQILPANGASEAMHLALSVLPKGRVALPVPCFSEYGAAAEHHGHSVHSLHMADCNYLVPWPTYRYEGVVLGHPNNPTSRLLERKCLEAWLNACEWGIVDEAFIEMTNGGESASHVPLLKQFPNLIVLRAFTKSLAIPGLRLGYALGDVSWIQRMKEHQIPWSVNALAQAVAVTLPALDGYREKTSRWLADEPAWLHEQLVRMGVSKRAWKPDTNFILCRSELPSAELVRRMAERGILVRDASNFAGLDDRYFRVAVRLRSDNERLLTSLRRSGTGTNP